MAAARPVSLLVLRGLRAALIALTLFTLYAMTRWKMVGLGPIDLAMSTGPLIVVQLAIRQLTPRSSSSSSPPSSSSSSAPPSAPR